MRFTFVAPGLASIDRAALASSRSLARLASWAKPRTEPRGIAAALLAAFGAPLTDPAHDVPVAPLSALGAGLDPHHAFVLAAEPVSLVAGREDVAVAARVDDLDEADATVLVDALNAHFRSDGVVFAAPRPDAWFATMTARPEMATAPLDDALGATMAPNLPTGRDARTWQRWSTEIQMLLHAHPVNAERERRGRAPLNGIWFWGGGALADVGLVAPFRAHVPEGRAGDLVRGLARHAGGETMPRPGSFEATIEMVPATRPATHVAVVLPDAHDATSLAALDAAWLAPAIAWLERGRLASITLVANGAGAAVWSARRPSMPARLLAGVAPRRFAPPRK